MGIYPSPYTLIGDSKRKNETSLHDYAIGLPLAASYTPRKYSDCAQLPRGLQLAAWVEQGHAVRILFQRV